jgi:hypothetical protein
MQCQVKMSLKDYEGNQSKHSSAPDIILAAMSCHHGHSPPVSAFGHPIFMTDVLRLDVSDGE